MLLLLSRNGLVGLMSCLDFFDSAAVKPGVFLALLLVAFLDFHAGRMLPLWLCGSPVPRIGLRQEHQSAQPVVPVQAVYPEKIRAQLASCSHHVLFQDAQGAFGADTDPKTWSKGLSHLEDNILGLALCKTHSCPDFF